MESLICKYLKAGVVTPQRYEGTRVKNQYVQDLYHKTAKVEISWFWILQRTAGQKNGRADHIRAQ